MGRFMMLAAGAAAAAATSDGQARVGAQFGATWDAQYASNALWKVVNVTAGGSRYYYVLVTKGTTAPTVNQLVSQKKLPAGATPTFFTTPISKAALLSTTQIQWAEMLGKRASIAAVPGGSYVSSACVKKMMKNGATKDALAADGYSTNMASLAGADAVFCTPGWGCPGTAVDVVFPDASENTLRGQAEMIEYLSLWYNAESVANEVSSSVIERLSCTQSIVNAASAVRKAAAVRQGLPVPAKPKVLWAYNYGGTDGWYVGSCPNYYCEAIAAAGGEMLLPTEAGTGLYGAYTDAQMTALASTADIWLYASDNWDSQMKPALTAYTQGTGSGNAGVGAVLASSPAISRSPQQVYDFMRRGTNSWFEERAGQPDLLVQDLTSIISPDAMALAGAFSGSYGNKIATHSRFWWRNVATETRVTPSTACADVALAAAKQLASDACPRRGSTSPLPTPSGSRTPSKKAPASKTATKKAAGKLRA